MMPETKIKILQDVLRNFRKGIARLRQKNTTLTKRITELEYELQVRDATILRQHRRIDWLVSTLPALRVECSTLMHKVLWKPSILKRLKLLFKWEL